MTPSDYAALGYEPFPCAGKRPARCSTWPSDTPFRDGDNIGIVVPVGAIVIDLDRKPDADGVRELAAIAPDGWKHTGARALTGGGGLHLWFRASALLGLGNARGDLKAGIDVRGGGRGYVIVPPSIHPDTDRIYEWLTPLLSVPEIPEIPDWLLARLLASPIPPKRLATSFPSEPRADVSSYMDAALASACDRVRSAEQGTRNDTLNHQAYEVAGFAPHGLDLGRAEENLYTAATQAGLTPREARATIQSALRAGERRPRDLPKESRAPGRGEPSPVPDTSSTPRDRTPTIQITTDEPGVNNQAIAALAAAQYPDLYQRVGELTKVVRYVQPPGATKLQIPDGQPTLRTLSRSTLQERLAGAASWQRYDARAKDWRPTHPPPWSVSAVQDRGRWKDIPSLRGIADYPLIRADGSFVTRPGYDPGTGFFLGSIPADLKVSARPTQADAAAAAQSLLELVSDFPLVDDVDRASWLAFLITPLARAIIEGPTPLFVATANVRGTGKTLIFTIPGWILTGRDLPAQRYGRDDEEIEKILVSVARLGLPILLFDNVKVTIGGASLDKWLTSTTPTGRILGRSEVALFDWTTILAATSNNAAVAGDTDRRSIYCKQESAHERPELRSGFRFPALRRHVFEHRGELLSHALTILRGYLIQGSPEQGGRPKGSFEAWARAVRDPLLWAGLPDCERPPDDPARPVDSDSDELAQLLAGLWEHYAGQEFTVGEMLDSCYPDSGIPVLSTVLLRDALARIAYRGDRPTRQRAGKVLAKHRSRWLNDMALFSEYDDHRKINVWRVISRESAGSACSCGDGFIQRERTVMTVSRVRGSDTTRTLPDYPQADNQGDLEF